MWPFSNKKKESKPAVSVAQALESLAAIGIRRYNRFLDVINF